jgi:hypothetical protein
MNKRYLFEKRNIEFYSKNKIIQVNSVIFEYLAKNSKIFI